MSIPRLWWRTRPDRCDIAGDHASCRSWGCWAVRSGAAKEQVGDRVDLCGDHVTPRASALEGAILSATLELDGTIPVNELADAVESLSV